MYEAQGLKTCRNDWISLIKNDESFYQITLSDFEISEMSKSGFKKYVEQKINLKAYNELMESTKSKVENTEQTLKHDKQFKIIMQPYLKTNDLTTNQKQALFSLRNRSFNLKSNYKTQYEYDMRCRTCFKEDSFEDELHLFEQCSSFKEEIHSFKDVKFEHIYGTLSQQINAIKHYMPIINKRNLLIELYDYH